MNASRLLLGSVLLAAIPAVAYGDIAVSGSVDAGFASESIFAVPSREWTGGAKVLVSLDDPGFNVQIEGHDRHIDLGLFSGDLWSGTASAFWRDAKGSFGASFSHGDLSALFSGGNVNSYGVFGEYFATRDLTLRWKGGGFDQAGGSNGWYAGAGGAYYVLPDLSLNISYNYTDVSGAHLHNIEADVDYQIMDEWPLAVGLGYRYSSTTGTTSSAVLARLSYRFNMEGSMVTLDRHGPVTWNGAAPFL